jgi:hypothetical protein
MAHRLPAVVPEKRKGFSILHSRNFSTPRGFNHLGADSFGSARASNLVEVARGSMKTVLGELKQLAMSAWQNQKIRKRVGWGLAIFVVLQLYFVRELLAAELLFGILFVFLFSLAALCYAVGTVGVHGREWAEVGARAVVGSARRGYNSLEEISKKPFRHPHSESAQ